MYYTGIGTRKTPKEIKELIFIISKKLIENGYTLRSGGAEGSDSFFEEACNLYKGKKEIYLPWKNFNHNSSNLYTPSKESFDIAESIHPTWLNLSLGAKKLHARNIHQVLGKDLKTPSNLVVYYAQEDYNGNIQGGTRTAVMLARKYNIPCYNLFFQEVRNKFN